jgi:hypothetical protein
MQNTAKPAIKVNKLDRFKKRLKNAWLSSSSLDVQIASHICFRERKKKERKKEHLFIFFRLNIIIG